MVVFGRPVREMISLGVRKIREDKVGGRKVSGVVCRMKEVGVGIIKTSPLFEILQGK